MSYTATFEGHGTTLEQALNDAASKMPPGPEPFLATVQEIKVTTGGITGVTEYDVVLLSA